MTTKPTIGADKIDNDVPTNGDWNRDVVQEGNWAQEVLAGTNTDKIAAAALSGSVGSFPNLLVNGGWEIWQRGTGPFTANGVITADRWKSSLVAPSTYTLSRNNATDSGSQYEGQVVYTHGASGLLLFYQDIENYPELAGKQIYLTARVSSSANNGLYISIADNAGSQASARYAGGGSVVTLSCTYTISATPTLVRISIGLDTATQTAHIDSLMACVAPAAVDYVPRLMSEERLLCRRYYQQFKIGTQWRTQVASEIQEQSVYFPTPMSAAPTATITAGTRANIASAATADVDTGGLRLTYTATAATTVTQALSDSLTLDTGT